MKCFSNTRSKRDGIAAFELVILLPTILALLWVILWFGFALIYKSELIVEARTKAWDKRYKNESEREWESLPLLVLMIPSDGIELKPLINLQFNDQYITETNTKKVSNLKYFEDWTDVNSKHVVLAGSWDHTELDMSEPPTFGLPSGKWIAHASAFGKAGQLTGAANQALLAYYRAMMLKKGLDNTQASLQGGKDKVKDIVEKYDNFSADLIAQGLGQGIKEMVTDEINRILKQALDPGEIIKGLVGL